MKTKVLNILKFLPIVLMAFTLGSCEELELDIDLGGESSHVCYSTDYLTSRVWVDEWKDDEGMFYHQELRFYNDHVGSDYMYTEDRWGYRTESSYDFTWDWRNSSCTSIRMKYGRGDYSYMEHISMGGNRLDCLLDGQSAYFKGR